MQTELVRVQAQLEAARRESDMRQNALNKKFQKAVEDRGVFPYFSSFYSLSWLMYTDFYVETSKNSDGKISTLQDQLMQAEAKIAKQQSDFQKLKQISISV